MKYAIVTCSEKKWIYPQNIYGEDGILNITLPCFNAKRTKKYAKKVNEFLEDAKISEIIVDDTLLKNKLFCNYLLDCKRYIITGRRIYKTITLRILREVSELMKVDIKRLKVALLLNGYSHENIELIKLIAQEVKSLTIVTTVKEYYDKILDELYVDKGIVLKVIEKNRANLKYVNVICNIDFPSYDLDSINISNSCIFVTGLAKGYNVKNNFRGIIIRKVDILAKKGALNNIDELALCEANTYSSLRKMKENDKNFDKTNYIINGFFGENGKITSEEFRSLGKILLDK